MRCLLPLLPLFLTISPVLALDCAPGGWGQGAPLPALRTEVAAAADGREIFVAGGMAADPLTDLQTIYRYDPGQDAWSALAKLDRVVNHTGLAVVSGTLFVVGGYEPPDNRPTAEVTAIDLSSGAIREVEPLPQARGALAAVVLDGRIHALGGTTDRSIAAHDVYDPATNSWSSAAPMQVPRNHLAAAVLDGRIYAFGGRDESTFLLDEAEVYDSATDRWTTVAAMPTGRSGIGAAALGSRIVVFGGEVGGDGGHTFAEAEAYDPASDSWEALAPMPTARHGLGVAAVGERIYTISGGPEPGLTVSDVNEVFCWQAD